MKYTEEEARKKWCPCEASADLCYGSSCMAWVWVNWIGVRTKMIYGQHTTQDDVVPHFGRCGMVKHGK